MWVIIMKDSQFSQSPFSSKPLAYNACHRQRQIGSRGGPSAWTLAGHCPRKGLWCPAGFLWEDKASRGRWTHMLTSCPWMQQGPLSPRRKPCAQTLDEVIERPWPPSSSWQLGLLLPSLSHGMFVLLLFILQQEPFLRTQPPWLGLWGFYTWLSPTKASV